MRVKLSKIIKDLNVGLQTVQDFFEKKKIDIEVTPNTKVDEDVLDILIKEFKPDMEQKLKSEYLTNARQKAKPAEEPEAPKQPEEIKTQIVKPKVIGKINLDEAGKPAPKKEVKKEETPESASKQEAAEVKDEPKAEVKVEPETEAKVEPKDEPKAEAKVEPKAEPKAEQPAAAEEPEPAAPAPVEAAAPVAAPATPATPAAVEPEAPKEEIFTTRIPELKASINVVGKIDLSAINQSTRPKKKSKEERKQERIAKEKARLGEDGVRKKRRRIGKEKVDIEKAAQQINNASGKTAKNKDNESQSSKKKDKKAKRPLRPQINEEDVQRQVKETLARLTTKKQNMGAKWRREKREAVREEESKEAALQAAEKKILKLTEFVTANDLAMMMNVPINKVIGTCMSLGVMVSINQRLDAETQDRI